MLAGGGGCKTPPARKAPGVLGARLSSTECSLISVAATRAALPRHSEVGLDLLGLSACEPLLESPASILLSVLASVSHSGSLLFPPTPFLCVSLFVCLPLSLTLFKDSFSLLGQMQAPYRTKNVYLQRYSTLHRTRELSESRWTGI